MNVFEGVWVSLNGSE